MAIALQRTAGPGGIAIRPFDERRAEHLAPKLRSRWVDGCPIAAGHRGLRAALDRMQDPLCIGGVGVVSWGCAPPLETLFSPCCLGISPSVVSGMYHGGTDHQELLAVMGDSSFCHSGVQSLMNAVHNGARLTFVIFDNRRTAETEEGGQPNPASPDSQAPRVSLAALVRACGVDQLSEPDPFDTGAGPRRHPARGGGGSGQRRAAERRLSRSVLHRPAPVTFRRPACPTMMTPPFRTSCECTMRPRSSSTLSLTTNPKARVSQSIAAAASS